MSTAFHPGEKIRLLREDQRLSTEELAQRSQTSAAFIEHLESGAILPSLGPLMKIARGLGVRLGAFLDDESHTGPAVMQREQIAEKVIRFTGENAPAQDTLDFHALASAKKDRHMEPFLIDAKPSASRAPALSSHEGEEFLYVLDGAVEVTHGNNRYVLNAGDCIYYDSVVPHEVRAANEESARFLAVVYAPL